MSAEETFNEICVRLAQRPGVQQRKAFSSPGLRVGGKVFAMLVRGELVVKLPAERCAELVQAGARPFQSGGRPLREWVTIRLADRARWGVLAEEALTNARFRAGAVIGS